MAPDESERETRRKRIDPVLKDAGWTVVPFNPAHDPAMTDGKGYKSTDKRRSFAQGAPPRKRDTFGLPSREWKELGEPLEKVTRLFRVHLDRTNPYGKVSDSLWLIVRGLFLGALQTHRAVLILVSDKRGFDTFPNQAESLARGLLEALGNLMALAEDRQRVTLFLRDGYKTQFKWFQWRLKTMGGEPKHKRGLNRYRDEVMQRLVKQLGLTPQEANDPVKWLPEDWPSPHAQLKGYSVRTGNGKRKVSAFITGQRAAVFEYMYKQWYSDASALAHQRMAAIKRAFVTEHADAVAQPGRLESNIAIQATVLLGCFLAELEDFAQLPSRPDLRVLWERLRADHGAAAFAFETRYRVLLGIT